MEETEIKIDGLDSKDWNALTEIQKAHILKGLEQADAGIGKSLTDFNNRSRSKYGLMAKK